LLCYDLGVHYISKDTVEVVELVLCKEPRAFEGFLFESFRVFVNPFLNEQDFDTDGLVRVIKIY